MSSKITRRALLGGLAGFSAGTVLADAPVRSLRPVSRSSELEAWAGRAGAERIIGNAGLRGVVACAVADVKTGVRLESIRGDTGLPPASVAKTLTTLYALDTLGPGHRFVTRLMATGPVKNGVLRGDLILAGGGDPTLGTDQLAHLAAGLKKAGLREVQGNFVVFEGALPFVRTIDAGQPDHVGYSPAVSGIALNYNRVHFEWRRGSKGYAVAMDARSDKYRPTVDIARMKVVARDLPVYTYADRGGRDQWTVASRALGDGGSRWLPVRRPAEYAGDVFRTLARAQGIVLKKAQVSRALPRGATELVRVQSDTLRDILRGMLKWSNNLTAEMVGMSASAARGGRPESLADSADRMNRWAAQTYGMTGTRLVDHSGLGDASRMTPHDLVDALVKVRQSGVLRPLLKPIALRDAQGRVMKSHPIKVNAKTGTLNFVSGLGGFMTAADGTELAFAIFAADVDTRARIKRADREVPEGARAWNRKAKRMQQALIERWGALYGS